MKAVSKSLSRPHSCANSLIGKNGKVVRKRFHVPTLCGLPAKAQEHPPAFCQAVRLSKDGGRSSHFLSILAEEVDEEPNEEEEEGLEEALDNQIEAEERRKMRGEVNEEEKKSILKLSLIHI